MSTNIQQEVAKAFKPVVSVNPYSIPILLKNIKYDDDSSYIPSDFALSFVNFIKLVNGGEGEENLTPVLHYKMLDKIALGDKDVINMLFRGSAKSTLYEYLLFYIAIYKELPNFKNLDYVIYVSDSIDNGVTVMKNALQFRYNNSSFLQKYLPKVNFTVIRWSFENIDGEQTIVRAYGAKTGVRGTRELGKRVELALLDDLISDADANSDTIIASVEDTVNKAIEAAMHPTRRKIIWSGTPFNARDPLYKAVESGAWEVNVYPVCETFPCTREEFKGAWEDRFTYDAVLRAYNKALKQEKLSGFYQEFMLQIMSEEERMILDEDIIWYNKENVLRNRNRFNFYITTDFATSEDKATDFSVISVWAYNSNGDWFWVDGILERQLMDKNIKDLFRLVQMYKPQQVGIEVSGQQSGFIQWIQNEMITKNTWFTIASEGNSGKPGIRPSNTTSKLERFNLVVPWFKAKKIYFPEEMKLDPILIEGILELSLISINGFKSKKDDFIDTVAQLAKLTTWKPSEDTPSTKKGYTDIWEEDIDDNDHSIDSYIA